MANNFELVVINDLSPDVLLAAGWASEGIPLPGPAALSITAPGPSAAMIGGDLVLADPVMEIGVLAHGLAAALDRPVFAATFGIDADLYVWRAADEHGDRELQWVAGDLRHESGEPHPAEDGLGELDEATLWTLLERTTGLTEAAVLAAQFQPVTPPVAMDEEA